MNCPACQTENPETARFCLNCGEKLAAICPQCQTSLPPTARFCSVCGTKLDSSQPVSAAETTPAQAGAAAPEPDAIELLGERLERHVPKEYLERLEQSGGRISSERRMITILFADLKGYTSMSERLDPEEVVEIMNQVLALFIAPVNKHGGTVARLMGDGLLAFFGAPVAHENDPERAVRAGLEIIAGIKAHAAHLAQTSDIGFAQDLTARVGINTGLVVTGEVGSDLHAEYTAMGDAINLAARMEQNAPPGNVMISHNTYQQVRGLFDVLQPDPIRVKGKAEPVRVYLVQRARPMAFRLQTRGIEGLQTPLVGRESEMNRLLATLETVTKQGRCQMLTVVGEAGLGKSRLLYEFESRLQAQRLPLKVFHGRASQEMQPVPYALLRTLFALRFGIQESDPTSIARTKFEDGICDALCERFDNEPDVMLRAHFIGQLLGFDFSDSPYMPNIRNDPQQLRDRAQLYLGEYFQAQARDSTMLLLFDDIHWADESSLETIPLLASELQDQRLYLILLARPTLYERHPLWASQFEFHSRLDLSPLSEGDSQHLIGEILQKVEAIPDTLQELIARNAEGNPFYLEELIKMLIDDQVITTEDDTWQVDVARLTDLRVPASLTSVLQARLDSLTPDDRTTLQQASVIGHLFWDEALVRLSDAAQIENAPSVVQTALSNLQARGMVFRHEPPGFSGVEEYAFQHITLRDVAYEGILKRLRRRYHALVADWLVERSGERASEHAGLIAEHLEQAGRAGQAAVYLRRAGEQAAAQFANREAVNYFSRALALTEDIDQEGRYALLLARQKVYHLLGERQAQSKDLQALLSLTQALDASQHQAEVALEQAAYFEATSDFPAALQAAEGASRLAQEAGETRRQIQGLIAGGRALMRQGAFRAAQERLEQALQLAQEHAERACEAESLHCLGTVRYFLSDYSGAERHLKTALSIREQLDDLRGEAHSLNNLAGIYHALGDFSKSKEINESALKVTRAIGYRRQEVSVTSNLGILYHVLGDFERASAHFLQAMKLCRAVGARREEALAAMNFGLVQFDLGEYRSAREHFQMALQVARDTGDRKGEGDSLTCLALALEILGEKEPAVAAYRQALELRREIGRTANAIDNLAGLARMALQMDQLEPALAYAEEALAWIDEHGPTGLEYPLRVYLTCADVLQAVGQKERAAASLTAADELLSAQASRISDPDARRAFLEQVPLHRQVRLRVQNQP